MKGLFLFIGEAFRFGSQNTKIRGIEQSYEEQIKASKSHVQLIKKIEEKYQLEKSDVVINSYNTQYNEDLLKIYNEFLINCTFNISLIGLNNLFHNCIHDIQNSEIYDFVFYIRIDLFLKDLFFEIIDINQDKILFPSICWFKDCMYKSYPRINDMMIFIPKQYYSKIQYINVYHDAWYKLVKCGNMKNEDLDLIINTFHDSDSEKDYNPLYYIVNRDESTTWHSPGKIFNKNDFLRFIQLKKNANNTNNISNTNNINNINNNNNNIM